MKQIFFCVAFILGSLFSAMSQTWTCDNIKTDIEIFNGAKKGNNKWAEAIMPRFPLNKDNELETVYVITCSDSIPRLELIALTEGWLGTVFAKARDQIKVSNEDQIVCTGSLGQVAFEQKYIGATRVLAPLEIVVLYKDNRVRLSIMTKNYSMAYANIGQLESGAINIANTFPFDKNSKHKGAYAIAYINTVGKHLNLALGFLDYLNKHSSDNKREESDW